MPCTGCGALKAALSNVKHSVYNGVRVPNSTFYALLKRCIAEEDSAAGRVLHQLTLRSGERTYSFLKSHLIRMYASFGDLAEANRIFESAPEHDVFTWSAMIDANVRSGYHSKAIDLYVEAHSSATNPDGHIFVAVLRACGNGNFLQQGQVIHNHILQNSLDSVLHVVNALMDMYFKCKSIADGLCLFERLHGKDLVSWNTVLAAYVHDDSYEEALELFRRMQDEGIKPNAVSWNTIISGHAQQGKINEAFRFFKEMRREGIEPNTVTWNALILGYAERGLYEDALNVYQQMQERMRPDHVTLICILRSFCKRQTLEEEIQAQALPILESSSLNEDLGKSPFITIAKEVFVKLPKKRPVEAWNAMIAACAELGDNFEALCLFDDMQSEEVRPNNVTFASILKLTSSMDHVLLIHAAIVETGLYDDAFLCSTLIHMYSRCGSLNDALGLFDGLFDRDKVTWTAMLGAYTQHGYYMDALWHFCHMQQEDIIPNRVTFLLLLKICGSLGIANLGYVVHTLIIMSGFELEMHVGSTLVDMYAKCSSFNDSLLTFNSMPSRHLAAWNAMIVSCAQFEHNHEALELFQKIWQQGMEPNDASYVSLLKTCSTMASIDIGKLCHASCVETGDANDIQVSSALVDMYSKCGSIEDAIDVFAGLPVRDIVTWNAMVSGYVKAGDEVRALQCFQDIRKECVKPDGVTFLSLLSACSRMRFRREGISMFLCMVQDKDIVATPEHYNCMVELLGSRGDWTEAHDLFSTMPASPNIVGWTSLLKQYGKNTDMTIKKRT